MFNCKIMNFMSFSATAMFFLLLLYVRYAVRSCLLQTSYPDFAACLKLIIPTYLRHIL